MSTKKTKVQKDTDPYDTICHPETKKMLKSNVFHIVNINHLKN